MGGLLSLSSKRDDSSTERLSKLSLKFGDSVSERGFIELNGANLKQGFCICCFLASVIMSWFLVSAWRDSADNDDPELDDIFASRIQLFSVALAWSFTSFIFTVIPYTITCPRLLEYIVAGHIALVTVCMFLFSAPHHCRVIGVQCPSFQEGRPEEYNAAFLLGIDVFVTASHLVMPIRFCVLWSVALVATLCCFADVLVFSPAGGATTFPLILCLISLSVVGKRSNERIARRSFVSVMKERELRCEAEKKLYDTFEQARIAAGAEIKPLDDQTSLPSTTQTGRIFADDDLNMGSLDETSQIAFQELIELGAKERWLLNKDHIHLSSSELLGVGGYGIVAAATYYGSPVAVKIPLAAKSTYNLKYFTSMLNELRILRHIRHSNLVLMYGACVDLESQDFALVLERIEGVALDALLRGPDSRSLESIHRQTILLDVCCALRYLHSQTPCVVHSDLKASNVVVQTSNSKLRAKLCDFGFARLKTRSAKLAGGTMTYMAPEMILGRTAPSKAVDVFSFGRLTYFVITGISPLEGVKRPAFVSAAKAGRFPALAWPSQCPFKSESQAMVQDCLQFDVSLRPTMESVHTRVQSWQTQESAGRADEDETCAPVLPWRDAVSRLRAYAKPQKRTMLDRLLPRSGKDALQDAQRKNDPLCATAFGNIDAAGTSPTSDSARITPGMRNIVQFCPETPVTSRILMLTEIVQQWNFNIPDDSCCPLHAALHAVDEAVKTCRKAPCLPEFCPVGTRQCGKCGVLTDGVAPCALCDAITDSVRISMSCSARLHDNAPALQVVPENVTAAESIAPRSSSTFPL